MLDPGEYLASYISSAHIGAIQKWLNSGRKESPQEMALSMQLVSANTKRPVPIHEDTGLFS
ncbi:TetR-like C-terminal domain-containing protein [Bacillus sp. SCS-153A]|uniref:TetR-like C-terminal domain-containing protein n=1 Tax=Rossellomorea sedimentorum TaxID=3115294 RepID=UPI0039067583